MSFFENLDNVEKTRKECLNLAKDIQYHDGCEKEDYRTLLRVLYQLNDGQLMKDTYHWWSEYVYQKYKDTFDERHNYSREKAVINYLEGEIPF